MLHDFLQRFMFEEYPVRGTMVRLDQAWQEVQSLSQQPTGVRQLLGETLVASALLTSNIKFKGTLGLQIQSQGLLRLLLAQCTDEGDLRGVARLIDEKVTDEHKQDALIQDGVLSINLEPAGNGQRYQGIVSMSAGSLSQALEDYFEQSEQLQTRIWLMISDHACAGLMLQRMPGEVDDDDAWNRLAHLASTVTSDEMITLNGMELLRRLFHEEDVRLFDPSPLRAACNCSQEKVAGMLRTLGEQEVRDMIRQDSRIEVGCEYCSAKYVFDEVDALALFSEGDVVYPDNNQPQ